MRVLSLFSGGGLGDYGLTLAGMEIVGQVEIDEYCQKVLELRWPKVPKWTDIKAVEGDDCFARSGAIDLISGGFPCQDISTAGKGAGITGERSGLWKEMLRIIREVRPRYVLVENVTALLGRGLGTVLGDLAEIGYDCEWDCIPASALGAPHQRDRVWIVAYTSNFGCDMRSRNRKKRYFQNYQKRSDEEIQQERNERELGSSKTRPDVADTKSRESRKPTERKGRKDSIRRSDDCGGVENKGREICDTTSKGLPYGSIFSMGKSGSFAESQRSNWWTVEPNVGRVAHGIAKRVDRLKLLGNGQVVQVVEWIGKRIMEFDAKQEDGKGV